tara:strand:+ start:1043 stop:1912 length:870 start_codon:yes stop_codon:yes gene_type:complete
MYSKQVVVVFEYLESEAKKYPVLGVTEMTDIRVYINIVSKLLKTGVEYIENDDIQLAYVVLLRCCLICSYDLVNHVNYRKYKDVILNKTKIALDFLEKIKPIIIKRIESDVNSVKLRELESDPEGGRMGSLSRSLDKYGLVELNVPGDGNCQFHAISDQLAYHNIANIDHMSLRRLLADWLMANTNVPMDDCDEGEETNLMQANGYVDIQEWARYLILMKNGRLWGDNATLLAACAVFGLKIKVISSEMGYVHKISCPPVWKIIAKYKIYLIHIFEMHYNSTRKNEDIV